MLCTPNAFTLPTIEFVGGTTVPLSFNTYARNTNQEFDFAVASGESYTATFQFTNYLDSDGIPLKTLTMDVEDSALSVTIEAVDTKELSGKYIYQIAVTHTDKNRNVSLEVQQGILFIHNNIDRNVGGMTT